MRRTKRLLLAALLASVLPAAGADGGGPPSAAPVAPSASAPVGRVMLGNREVAVLRATVLGVGAPERARLASDRIAALLERGVPDEVHVVTEPSGKVFSIAGRGLFVLTPGDLDEARGETLDGAVAAAGRNLATALAEARERRSLPHLLRAMGWSVAATLVLVLLLVAVERSRRWLLERAVAAARERMRELHVPGALLESDHVYLGTKRGLLFVARALELAAVYLWLTFVLERFAWTRPWGEQLGTWLLRTLSTLGLAALAGLPGLVVVAVIFVATRFLVKLIGLFFTAVEEGRVEVSPALAETAEPTRKIVTVVVWVFALIMAYPYLPGSGSEAFKGVGVMVGLMVSLGSTALIGQLASGFVLPESKGGATWVDAGAAAPIATCCDAGDVCLSGVCVVPGAPCTDSYDCEPGQFCEPTLDQCLPQPDPLTCELVPSFSTLSVTTEWAYTDHQIISIPVVANLDGQGAPEVVVNLTQMDGGGFPGGRIAVLDGRTGAVRLA
ncbi:mechanosensitive ion channel family protein, partial [Acidobacteria bacterium ACD]|nr:mechanosensitive ion channel family protein [Acidobacteria bacterium ACD]